MRTATANRLQPAAINLAQGAIRYGPRILKTKRPQYIEGYPPVMAAWLKIAPEDSHLSARNYLRLKCELFTAAAVPHPHNCLRHSFATYHLASRQNPGLTAYLLCHRNQQELWDHYKGSATEVDGLEWEKFTPARVTKLAEKARRLSGARRRASDRH